MSFTINLATPKEKPLIHALLQPYLAELSTFPGETIDYKDADGVYHYPYLDACWQEAVRFPYLLYNDKDLAGFALVRKADDHYEIAEYYVKPEFRHVGLGRTCAAALLNQHPGAWRIEFNRHNQASRNLWKNLAQRFASGKITEGKTDGSHDFIEFSVSPTAELFQYYNERAPEYEAFYYGRFPTPRLEPDIYLKDREPIQSLVGRYIGGKCVDIACGTGFWLPYYYLSCSAVTLIDQSENMLAECREKIAYLGIGDKASLVKSDVFNPALADGSFDSALIGFFISHFDDGQLADFMKQLKAFLKPGGRFVIIDSNWGDMNQSMRLAKAGIDERQLFDGRKFSIYKRFFEKQDLRKMANIYGMELEIKYWGQVFFMAVGRFTQE